MDDTTTYLWSLTAFRLRHAAAVGVYFSTYDRNSRPVREICEDAARVAEAWAREAGANPLPPLPAYASNRAPVDGATTIDRLADRFAAMLREDLSGQQFAEVRRRNATPAYAGCCASQDFCDANMTMAAAFEEVVGRDLDFDSDADIALWNRAWDVARERHLVAKAEG